MESDIEIPQKIGNRASIWSSYPTSDYSKELKSGFQIDIWNRYFYVHFSVLSNQEVETTYMSIDGCIDKDMRHTHEYIYNGMLFTIKKESWPMLQHEL